MKNWLIVANAARARLLEEAGTPGAYVHRADWVHPQSRQKGIKLDTDRAGHVLGGHHHAGGAAYSPRSDAHDREHDRFAAEIAAVLDAGVASGECAGIVLVASNPFLGHLKAHLGEQSRRAILRTVSSDYTSLRDDELHELLAS